MHCDLLDDAIANVTLPLDMSDNAIILHPRDPMYRPQSPAVVLDWLEQSGLIRDGVISEGELPDGERRTYRTGHAFSELLQIDKSVLAEDICEVVVVGPLAREWFLASGNTGDPVCPRCGNLADWQAIAHEWYEDWQSTERRALTAACSVCAVRVPPWDFDWGHTAAFSRWYIELRHLVLGGAEPSPTFLHGLTRVTGTPWSFIGYRL